MEGGRRTWIDTVQVIPSRVRRPGPWLAIRLGPTFDHKTPAASGRPRGGSAMPPFLQGNHGRHAIGAGQIIDGWRGELAPPAPTAMVVAPSRSQAGSRPGPRATLSRRPRAPRATGGTRTAGHSEAPAPKKTTAARRDLLSAVVGRPAGGGAGGLTVPLRPSRSVLRSPPRSYLPRWRSDDDRVRSTGRRISAELSTGAR